MYIYMYIYMHKYIYIYFQKKKTSDCLIHKILFSSIKFFSPKILTGGQIGIKMILSDYKGLKSKNFRYQKIITHIVSFNFMHKTCILR